MLTRFEGAANDARMHLIIGRLMITERGGEAEGEVLMVVIERRDSFRISIGADNPTAAWIEDWAGIVCVGASDALAYAKTCIDECLREHTSCRDFFDWAKPEASLPTRLVDCSDPRRPRLINTKGWDPHNVRYIALSYVWGGDQPNRTTKKTIASYQKAIRVHQEKSGCLWRTQWPT
ncbi:hypothetical protein C8Q73DRAFT_791120 [Cubamyces lactineus]|nr:hypothetical protein C8Q73DRAFT_791120 [Cubamyces lactineus]